jgi:exodeoxyribonuclease VII small subunit
MTEATETDFSRRQSLSYARAIEELEAILDELEDDNLDVDRLAQRVGRAATLIRLCRERIGHTRLEVERIVADLDGAGASPTEVAPPPAPGP